MGNEVDNARACTVSGIAFQAVYYARSLRVQKGHQEHRRPREIFLASNDDNVRTENKV